MLFQELDPGFHSARQKPVVVIEKQYIFALTMQDTRIACSGDPPIGLVYVMNPTRECNFGCLVGRAIIDRDNFDPGVGLQPYTFDGFGQITGRVVTGDHHRNQWRERSARSAEPGRHYSASVESLVGRALRRDEKTGRTWLTLHFLYCWE